MDVLLVFFNLIGVFAWILALTVLLLISYKGHCLEAPELTSIDKKGDSLGT